MNLKVIRYLKLMKNSPEYMREYMRKNGHKYAKNYTVVHKCEVPGCGGVYRMTTRARHYKTKKHQKALQS